ncbi:Threonine efflux protein [Pseudovibrio axinellae]|uniref:Threonine efflux protein n=1 Tax=Pseudovibrio axinellae TaxID=989403 RepID=A0A165XZ63_9HYPH|nr:LysE family translocator [Pseudovibrio axinellae]KZL18262.1 Threonine efflux protein [Pseudovibrio axinellae]SER72443.1 Threonine/homoserine/homoserine lactone efflux protein [Pseudovibrio axinellae]
MTWADVLSFIFVASLLVISPGPNGVLIAKTVPTSGRAAGFGNIAGFVTAFYLHGALAILGISIVLVQSATAFSIVKYVGAAYLCWVGIKALLAAVYGTGKTANVMPSARPRTLLKAYSEGFLTNLLNPKVSMFYLAAFPQFMAVGENAVLSSFMLVFLHSVINAIWFAAMVLLFSRLVGVAQSGRFQRWLKAVTGGVFIAFGVKLAVLKASL